MYSIQPLIEDAEKFNQTFYTCLTHWGQDKMADILHTTFSNAFPSIKVFEFWLKFHWILFLRVQLTINQHWFRKWLGTEKATSHYLSQCWQFPDAFMHHLTSMSQINWCIEQCRRKTFMVHQTFVWWALYILYIFVKFPIRHLGLAIGNVRCVRCFSPTLHRGLNSMADIMETTFSFQSILWKETWIFYSNFTKIHS